MPKPSTDRIDVDTRLKQMGCGRMANDMRTDPFSLQRRHRGTQLYDVAFNERVNAITRQRLSATVHEQVRLGGTLPREVTKVPESRGPERAAALLVPFTMIRADLECQSMSPIRSEAASLARAPEL